MSHNAAGTPRVDPAYHDYLQANDPYSYSADHLRPSMEDKTPLGSRPSTMTPNAYDSHHDLTTPRDGAYIEPGLGRSVPRKKRSRTWLWIGIVAALLIIGAVLGGVLGTQLNKKSSDGKSSDSNSHTSTANPTDSSSGGDSSAGTGTASASSTAPSATAKILTGTDGSTVTMDDGNTFTYVNKFGGSWAVDSENPYNSSGQAQSWTPKITEEWVYGTNKIYGVNLGGWLVTEPFIVPGLYEQYQTTTPVASDEYTLSQAMGADLATKMEEHYKTFITEQDFAEIAAAGLNWVRIPIGFWAIGVEDGEPFLPRVSWNYFLKAIDWARKYGLRINLDLHALPGSQNSWNHSGRGGSLGWMVGLMGISNAERSLEYLRTLAEFISQPGIKEVVPMLSLVNEVLSSDETANNYLATNSVRSFYYQAYQTIRGLGGYGKDNGPILAIHDSFMDIAAWAGFMNGADRIALDEHLYLAFGQGNQNTNIAGRTETVCSWGGGTNSTQKNFGIVIGGEWSIALGDCGKWLNGVGNNPSSPDCGTLDRYQTWTPEFKSQLMNYAMSQMDALQNWFFWTWRIGNSTEMGYPTSPMWHYRLGLNEGWMPADPRSAGGICRANNHCAGCDVFDGTHPASATGGVAAPTIAADQVASYGTWPPTTLQPNFNAAQVALLPTYTQTGSPVTLPMATPTPSGAGNGWFNAQDTKGAYVKVKGCTYVGAYDGATLPAPAAACTGTP